MASESLTRLRNVRKGIAKARALRKIIRETQGQLRRDAAIITFTRTLDQLLEDLIALEDAGVLRAMTEANTDPPPR